MDVFLMVCRKKTTIFLDAKEDSTILDVKKMVAGITKVKPHNLRLFKDREELKEERTVAEYGFTATSAKPQQPGSIGLAFRNDNGDWEDLEISPLSQPPELPEVMRPQPAEHEQPAQGWGEQQHPPSQLSKT